MGAGHPSDALSTTHAAFKHRRRRPDAGAMDPILHRPATLRVPRNGLPAFRFAHRYASLRIVVPIMQVMVLAPFIDMANHSAEGVGSIRFDSRGITLAHKEEASRAQRSGNPGSEVVAQLFAIRSFQSRRPPLNPPHLA